MNISMVPNNDVKTIHASQNDTQRKWEFTPFANGKALVSDLPMYIKSLKGNTLVWNQLVQNGNFASTSNWTSPSGTLSASNNIGRCTFTGSAWNNDFRQAINMVAGHKYLVSFDYLLSSASLNVIIFQQVNDSANLTIPNKTTRTHYSAIYTPATSGTDGIRWSMGANMASHSGQYYELSNVNIFDLTKMGLDVTADQFRALFPLDYYQFDSGSLLSFNGTGIKTTGKNLLNYDAWKTVGTLNGTSVWESNGVTITATSNDAYTQYSESRFPVNARIPVRVGEIITLSWESDEDLNGDVYIFPNGLSSGFVYINNRLGKSLSYTPVEGVEYVTIRFGVASSGNTIHFKNIMVRYDGTDSAYEPYMEITTNLPTLTYFPNGMRSAGSAYDELAPSKAITRIGAVDLGTLTWTYGSDSGHLRFFSDVLTNIKIPTSGTSLSNILCSRYEAISEAQVYNNQKVGCSITSVGRVMIYDPSFTDATAFKTAMSGVYLYYELATPTEEDVNLNLTYPIEDGGTEELLPSGLMNGSVDLGSLTWSYSSSYGYMVSTGIQSTVKAPSSNGVVANIFCPKYEATYASATAAGTVVGIAIQNNGRIMVYDPTFTDADVFKSAMDGITLWYEKSDSTPTTSPIRMDVVEPNGDNSTESFTYKATDASFANGTYTMVCKNLEIPLTASKGKLTGTSVIGMTNEPGFFDAKLKMTDSDGVCYSTKFQLHVERKP